MENNQREYYIGKKWKNNKCEKQIGIYYSLEAAKANCPKGYKIYTNIGEKVYSNENSTAKFLMIAAVAVAIFIGISYSYSYYNSTVVNSYYTKQFVMPNGSVIKYRGSEVIPYDNGMILIPKDGAVVILPNGDKVTIPEGSIVKPDGTIIIPDKNGKVTVDDYYNVIIEDGNGKIINENGETTKVNEGTVVTDDGNIVKPNKPGDTTIDDNGNVIIGDGGADVTLPNGEEKEVGGGTVVSPDGNVIEGNDKDKPVVNEDGTITVPPGGTVTTPDGKEEEYENGGEYVPQLNNDATLKSLTISGYQLSPVFSPNTTVYNVQVNNNISSIAITAQSNDYKAKVSGTGVKSLALGSNSFTISVTAEDGTKKDYIIIITRGTTAKNSDANLNSLSVDGYSLSPAFDSEKILYTVNVPNNVNSITINASVSADSKATFTGAGTKNNLLVGDNSFVVSVTAEDGTKKDYTIVVIRADITKSSNADLSSLSVDSSNLTIVPNKTTYTVNVPNNTSSVKINAKASDSKATVSGTGTKTLNVGNNNYTITVTAEDGTKKQYTVVVIRAAITPSNNADLSSLSVSGQTLSPNFNPNTLVYNVTVPNNITTVSIVASASNSKATVSGTGTKTLNVGNNNYTITVTAEDGTKKQYTVVITREGALDNNTQLTSLEVEGFSIVPNFQSTIKNYELTVDYEVTNINIKATSSATTSTILGIGNKSLEVGINTFSIQVTAEDGTKDFYYITVTRSAEELPSGTITLPDGTIIIPGEGTTLITDGSDNIYVKDGEATLIYPNGDKVDLNDSAIVKNDGNIINPNKPGGITIDNDGNIKIGDGGAVISKPGEVNKNLNDGAIIKDDGTIVNPNTAGKTTIDSNGNIKVGEGGAVISQPGEVDKSVKEGAIIKDDGTIINPNTAGKTTTDSNGNIIVGEGGAVITLLGGTDKTVAEGTIITPDGHIIEGNGTDKPVIDPDDGSIDIPPGGTVTDSDGKEEEYDYGGTYNPTDKSSDALLKDLKVDGYKIIPNFNPNISSYTLMVPYETAGANIIAITNHAKASVSGTGFKILDVGNNIFNITVTAENGNIKNYNIVIIRSSYEIPSESVVMPDGTIIIPGDGTNLIVDEHGNVHVEGENGATVIDKDGNVIPDGNNVPDGTIITDNGMVIIPNNPPGTTDVDEYGNIIIGDGGAEIILPNGNDKEVDEGTIITPDGHIIEGNGTEKPEVDPDDGSIDIPSGGTVTDPEGNPVEDYTPGEKTGDDATLMYLGIFGLNISPSFNPEITDYTLTVASSVSSVIVQATANDAAAEILGDGEKFLNYGVNVISIRVTAEDGTKKFYSITVIRSTEENIETTLYVLYDVTQRLTANGIVPGNVLDPVTFSVTYTGTTSGAGPDAINYNVIWTEVVNGFERSEDLVVTIKRNDQVIANKVPLPSVATANIVSDISINKFETHNYELIVEYLERGVAQDVDQGKSFSAIINVTLE